MEAANNYLPNITQKTTYNLKEEFLVTNQYVLFITWKLNKYKCGSPKSKALSLNLTHT
jgi:hypothetical protein